MPTLMKGKNWRDHKHKVVYPVVVQPKMDEIRCEVIVHGDTVSFLSYSGKTLCNMRGFAEDFKTLSKDTGHTRFDCGVEVNGNFNDSYRWVRSSKGVPADLVQAKVKVYLFDLPDLQTEYCARQTAIAEVVLASITRNLIVCEVPYEIAFTEDEVDAAYAEYTLRGYEGAMVKDPHALYSQGKRTSAWLKMKPEDTADGCIIDFVEAVCGKDQPEKGLVAGDYLNRIGSVVLRCEGGSFATPHGIAHDLGEDMYHNPDAYRGQWVEFKYMERDRQGGYRHPTFIRLREAKE